MASRLALLAPLLLAPAPASAGLSCDPASIAAALKAGIEQFKSDNPCGQKAALDWLNKLFPDGVPEDRARAVLFNGDADPSPYARPARPKRAPKTTAITAEMLDRAVAHVRERLRSDGSADGVTAGCTRDDVSGYWGPDPECAGSVCGKVEIGARWVAKVQNSSFEGEMPLRDADQVGNTVTHELVHLLVSYFRRVYGARDAAAIDGGLQEEFSYLTFFTGCTLYEVNNGEGRPHAPIVYVAPTDLYDRSRTGNEQAARMIAHEMQRCFNHRPNPYYFRILGDPRVSSTCSR